MRGELQDITGKRFGLVVVQRRAGTNEQGYPLWLVLCDCGNQRVVRGCVLHQNPPKTHRSCPWWEKARKR